MSALASILPDAPEGVEWSPTHLQVLDPSLPFETYERLMAAAGGLGDAARWILGDLLVFGEARYNEHYAQAIEAARLSERQLSRYRYVCQQVARSRRRGNLPFSYHEEVAPLNPDDQERLLARAEAERWPREQLREAARDARALEPKDPAPRQEVLDPSPVVVDIARNLSTVRETLNTIAGLDIGPEAADRIGLPQSLRALDEVGKTLTDTAAALDRPSLVAAVGSCLKNATASGGFYMVEVKIWNELAEAYAAR